MKEEGMIKIRHWAWSKLQTSRIVRQRDMPGNNNEREEEGRQRRVEKGER